VVLFKHALAAIRDDELAEKIGRLLKRRQGANEAERFLRQYAAESELAK